MVIGRDPNVASGSIASYSVCSQDVGFTPDSGAIADIPQPPLGATSGLMHRNKKPVPVEEPSTASRADAVPLSNEPFTLRL